MYKIFKYIIKVLKYRMLNITFEFLRNKKIVAKKLKIVMFNVNIRTFYFDYRVFF